MARRIELDYNSKDLKILPLTKRKLTRLACHFTFQQRNKAAHKVLLLADNIQLEPSEISYFPQECSLINGSD